MTGFEVDEGTQGEEGPHVVISLMTKGSTMLKAGRMVSTKVSKISLLSFSLVSCVESSRS